MQGKFVKYRAVSNNGHLVGISNLMKDKVNNLIFIRHLGNER